MKRILIVDDDPSIREVARMSLELMGGWEVCTVESGAEALERVRAERPDVVLLDVMMPEMDGPTTFRALQAREETRGIPVILLTAKLQPRDLKSFETLGVQGVLAKPFDPLTLHQQVAETLGWSV